MLTSTQITSEQCKHNFKIIAEVKLIENSAVGSVATYVKPNNRKKPYVEIYLCATIFY